MQGIIISPRTAQVMNGELRLERFRSADPEVIDLVAGADDPEAAVRRALSIGAHALKLAAVADEHAPGR